MKTDFAHEILIAEVFRDGFNDDIVFVDGGVIDFVVVEGEEGTFMLQQSKSSLAVHVKLSVVESFEAHGA